MIPSYGFRIDFETINSLDASREGRLACERINPRAQLPSIRAKGLAANDLLSGGIGVDQIRYL
jgi:hypothetical protein